MGSAPSDFGDYRLGRRIAVGGMAEIFRAERIADRMPVAIKLLLPQHARDPELVRMLADEARLQASLTHPNLVRVLEFGRVGKQPYIALELVDGVSLRDILRAGGALPVPLAVAIVADVVRALVVVHEARVVHRDVTPENILCSRRGEVRLGDFGIARSELVAGRTRTGMIKGKLAYLSPEQVTAATVDARTDLYASGLVLFEAITGEAYLRGETEPEILRAAEAPAFRSTSDASVDSMLRAVLAVAPGDRPATAQELLARIEALGPNPAGLVERVEQALRVTDDSDAKPGTVRIAAATRRRRPFVLVGAIAIAGAAAGGIYLARTRGEPPVAGDAPTMIDAGAMAMVDVPGTAFDGPAMAIVDGPGMAVGDGSAMSVDAGRGGIRDASVAAIRDGRAGALVDASKTDDAATSSDAPSARASTDQLRADYRAREILDADLPADVRGLLARAEAGDEVALTDARRAIEAIRIDEAFVKRKLERLGAAIRNVDQTKVDKAELDRLSAAALDDLLDGRYGPCNTRLNRIARLLGQQSP